MLMGTELKICGLRRVEDAKLINCFSEVKYAGLVFAKSKRQINVPAAREIMSVLRKDIKPVGVFADMPIEDIKAIVDMLNLNVVQLHSDESDSICGQLSCDVWKSISVKNEESLKKTEDYKNIKGFVLDTYSGKMRGGTGECFEWDIVRNFSQKHFTILAGGISADNISTAIKEVRPQIIDVSSSVEVDGYKNSDKILRLVTEFRKECE